MLLQTHKHLLKVGQRCIGEKHEEVLGNQKSAIMQLRQMLSDLELAKPPGIIIFVVYNMLYTCNNSFLSGTNHTSVSMLFTVGYC